jgi:multidrug resistance efflux pump
MARGFESKDVEFQQAEAVRGKPLGRALTADERNTQERHRTLELALTRAKADLAAARTNAHRQMLQDAIAALEDQLAALQP